MVQVATSLSSTDCFLLQSGHSVFIWHGSSTTFEQQNWTAKVAEFLKVHSSIFSVVVYLLFLINKYKIYILNYVYIFREETSFGGFFNILIEVYNYLNQSIYIYI